MNVVGHYDNRVGTTDAASAGVITPQLIEERPLLRPGQLLEYVPGLVVTQHSGAGKANQYSCAASTSTTAPTSPPAWPGCRSICARMGTAKAIRYVMPVGDGTLGFTGMAYRGKWNATDQVAQRAVDEGIVGRFGSLDDSDGGKSKRYSASADYRRRSPAASSRRPPTGSSTS